MSRTDILCVGRLKERYWTEAVAEYSKRLSAYTDLRILEVKDEKAPEKASEAEAKAILAAEAESLKKHLDAKACRIVLAIEGKQYSSEEFAALLDAKYTGGISHLQFVIGGSLGLDEEIKKGAVLLSFSKMTFPHQLMRVVLLEQIYRAHKILKGEPYHK
ncbi:MAG: 23S rRNA (pseudouridine(1915)-N(3))-methyltransferase RlmH [Lachnospiraceae bacterium]|nr:23S rRNA (pseudouridine(1915)-N(3))-methyltransferase RlmH [Lachnospiraceae bacterium]